MSGVGSVRVPVSTRQRRYEVVIGRGLVGCLGDVWDFGARRTVVVTDDTVATHHLEPALQGLAAQDRPVESIVVPHGEREKNPERLTELYERFYDLALGRVDTVVALGGGVVGDLAGYAAATFQRGLCFVQVPTTLLAMVDASVGGKVAVDFREGKNYLGTFYQPWVVVEDLDTLATLPEREVRNGWAEVVKHGFLGGGDLLELTDAALARGDVSESLVAGSVAFKAGIVGRDEREETGERAWLNLGHTLGHAIEAAGEFDRYAHGEAVGLGLRGALRLSARLCGLGDGEAERGQAMLTRAGLPERLDGIDLDRVLALVSRDKKAVAGEGRFVLLRSFGDPVSGVNVDAATQREVLTWLATR